MSQVAGGENKGGGDESREEHFEAILGELNADGRLSETDALGMIETTVMEVSTIALSVSDLDGSDVAEKLRVMADAIGEIETDS